MSEKTEQPTPKRIRDAREKGDVCKGQDVAPAATVLALAAYGIVNGREIFAKLAEMVSLPMSVMHLPFAEAMARCADGVLDCLVSVIAPVVLLVMGVALASLVAQTGFLFAPKAAVPKLENLSPARWFKKVFSVRNLFEFGKNLLKVAVLGAVVFCVLKSYIPVLFGIPRAGLGAMWGVLGAAVGELLLYSAGAFCVVAALDFLYQKYKWTQEHKMSVEEVKREYKESEGDPAVKSQRKQLYREMMSQGALEGTRRAKVLVVNPTHYAVALDYDREKTPLPVVVAKGEGALALRMVEAAKEAGVPVLRNVPLARALYRDGVENGYIPKDLIGPVAEVLRWVESLERRAE